MANQFDDLNDDVSYEAEQAIKNQELLGLAANDKVSAETVTQLSTEVGSANDNSQNVEPITPPTQP